MRPIRIALVLLLAALAAPAQSRLVLIDQDGSGPGGSDQMAMLALLQSPDVQVLGITIVTGDAWRDEEVQHTLRLLEIIGRTDIPVVPGAAFPLINSKEFIARWETLYGKLIYQGAIDDKPSPDPSTLKGADNYLNDALNAAMAGKPVAVAVTRPYGCAVHYGN